MGNQKRAIISCGVFYGEINKILEEKDWDVEFLPQGLHDCPNSEKMRDRIQQRIDELEAQSDYEKIVLGYGFCGGGMEGLHTSRSELVVPKVHDCIPLLAGNSNLKGNIAEPGTYYLSRGWIDCSCDSYKEYLFFTDQLESWKNKFNKYKQNQEKLIANDGVGWWFEDDSLDPQKRDREKFTPEISKKIISQYIKNYKTIALIDNDLLEDIHEEYAEEMFRFLNSLLSQTRGSGMEYKRLQTDLEPLRELLLRPETSKLPHVQRPGIPLQLEKKI